LDVGRAIVGAGRTQQALAIPVGRSSSAAAGDAGVHCPCDSGVRGDIRRRGAVLARTPTDIR
jgi:hypothetical protein